jgi:hypothetical protein
MRPIEWVGLTPLSRALKWGGGGVGEGMPAPMSATERGRPFVIIVALSALSWAVLVATAMAVWSAL